MKSLYKPDELVSQISRFIRLQDMPPRDKNSPTDWSPFPPEGVAMDKGGGGVGQAHVHCARGSKMELDPDMLILPEEVH